MSQHTLVTTTGNVAGGQAQNASTVWINKLKIVGSGQNWAVAPCEPFYLMGTEPPAPDAALTGAKNLIEHYGLENAYQKFCGKKLREELSAFLPNLSGNVDVPASTDDSGLMSLIERPPIRGKELRPFAPNQLDHAFRLHPGPLPQEYAALFAATPAAKHHHHHHNVQTDGGSGGSGAPRMPATAAPGLLGETHFPHRRRRYEVHRGLTAASSTAAGAPASYGGAAATGVFFPSSATAIHPNSAGHPPAVPLQATPSITSSINPNFPAASINAAQLDSVASTVGQDLPPGLIPVSANATPLTGAMTSSVLPPPPPLLTPLQHASPETGMPGRITHADLGKTLSSSSLQSTLSTAPPLLQTLSTTESTSAMQPHHHQSAGIPPGHPLYGSLYPSKASTSRSPSPDSKVRRSDPLDDDKRRKKRKEKKRRKDRE